jgi:hypothetical protein
MFTSIAPYRFLQKQGGQNRVIWIKHLPVLRYCSRLDRWEKRRGCRFVAYLLDLELYVSKIRPMGVVLAILQVWSRCFFRFAQHIRFCA